MSDRTIDPVNASAGYIKSLPTTDANKLELKIAFDEARLKEVMDAGNWWLQWIRDNIPVPQHPTQLEILRERLVSDLRSCIIFLAKDTVEGGPLESTTEAKMEVKDAAV